MNEHIGMFGGSRVGYVEAEVDRWLRERVRAASGRPIAEQAPEPTHISIITVKEVQRRTGLSRMTLWRMERDGRFPERVRLVTAPGGAAD